MEEEDTRPKMPLIYIFTVFFVLEAVSIVCLVYAIVKKYRRI